jgi:hypothetical protein
VLYSGDLRKRPNLSQGKSAFRRNTFALPGVRTHLHQGINAMPEPQRRWGIVRADWAAHSEVGADELAVLCLLSLHADKRDGTCYPSQTTLARSLKRSRPWVIAVLNRLEALGLVRRDPHPALRVRLYTVVGHADALSSCRKLPARDMSHFPDTPAQTSDMQCHPADTEQRASPVESSSQSAPGELIGQKPVSEPEVGIGFGQRTFSAVSAASETTSLGQDKTLPPIDWQPADADLAFVAKHAPLVDPMRFAARYVASCHAHGYRYRDHSAAYRTWLLNAWENSNANRPHRYCSGPFQPRSTQPGGNRDSWSANGDTARAALDLLAG